MKPAAKVLATELRGLYMRGKSVLLGLAAMGMVTSPVAASAREAAGLVSVSSGGAFVSRSGRLLSATPSMQLYKGDRVVTRADGSASVKLNGGCNVAVGASTITNVSSCDASSNFDRAGYDGQDSSLRGRRGGGVFIVAILALGAIIAGIVVVVRDNKTRPTSP